MAAISVDDGVSGASVAVARLADRSGIQKIFEALPQNDLHLPGMSKHDGVHHVCVRCLRESGRNVSVAKEAERSLRDLERAVDVKFVEDVRVLIERRSVTDLDDGIDENRTLRQRRQPVKIIPR